MKILKGEVISLNNAQTAHVKVSRVTQHPLYKKSIRQSSQYACHVEGLDLKVGDKVEIAECRPMSASKRFKVMSKVTSKVAIA